MATIRKRGKGYQIDYLDPNKKRVRKTFKRKKTAEAELGKRVSLIAEGRYRSEEEIVSLRALKTDDIGISVLHPSFRRRSGLRWLTGWCPYDFMVKGWEILAYAKD